MITNTNLIGEIVLLPFGGENVYGEIVGVLPYGSDNAFYIAITSGKDKGRIVTKSSFNMFDVKLARFFVHKYEDGFSPLEDCSSSSCLDEEDDKPSEANEVIDHSQYDYE